MSNIKRVVFLSGPMRGVPREEGVAWREKTRNLLESNFEILHALRGREKKETFPDPRLAVIRDKDDISRSSVVLVNDTFKNVSMIGTSMEVLLAYQLDKTVIIFGKEHENDYWLNYHSHVRAETLEDACDLANRMFSK